MLPWARNSLVSARVRGASGSRYLVLRHSTAALDGQQTETSTRLCQPVAWERSLPRRAVSRRSGTVRSLSSDSGAATMADAEVRSFEHDCAIIEECAKVMASRVDVPT